jgi:hypothetical protein
MGADAVCVRRSTNRHRSQRREQAISFLAVEMGKPKAIMAAPIDRRLQRRKFDRARPIAHHLRNIDAMAQRRGKILTAGRQPLKGLVGPIKESGLQEILSEFEECLLAQCRVDIGPIEQILMDANRAIGLTPAPEKLTQGKVQFDGFRVDPNHINEGVNGTIGLIIQQKIEAPEIGVGQ